MSCFVFPDIYPGLRHLPGLPGVVCQSGCPQILPSHYLLLDVYRRSLSLPASAASSLTWKIQAFPLSCYWLGSVLEDWLLDCFIFIILLGLPLVNMIVWGSIRVSAEDSHRDSNDLTSDNLVSIKIKELGSFHS